MDTKKKMKDIMKDWDKTCENLREIFENQKNKEPKKKSHYTGLNTPYKYNH